MKIIDIIDVLNAQSINIADENRQISKGYAGDFLSFVIGRAPTDCAWFTVMNNVNVAAVAALADVAVVVLCESVRADENLLAKAKLQGINIISTALDIYSAIEAVCHA